MPVACSHRTEQYIVRQQISNGYHVLLSTFYFKQKHFHRCCIFFKQLDIILSNTGIVPTPEVRTPTVLVSSRKLKRTKLGPPLSNVVRNKSLKNLKFFSVVIEGRQRQTYCIMHHSVNYKVRKAGQKQKLGIPTYSEFQELRKIAYIGLEFKSRHSN